jgi:hypothetical protein
LGHGSFQNVQVDDSGNDKREDAVLGEMNLEKLKN